MAISACPICNGVVDTSVRRCDHCGESFVTSSPAPPRQQTLVAESPPQIAVSRSLRSCRACGRQVSIHAPACPQCGQPFRRAESRVTTIEQTAKKWKAVMLFGMFTAFAFGTLGAVAAAMIDLESATRVELLPVAICGALTAAGLAIFVLGRMFAWWHHG